MFEIEIWVIFSKRPKFQLVGKSNSVNISHLKHDLALFSIVFNSSDFYPQIRPVFF